MKRIDSLFAWAARLDRVGMNLTCFGLVLVLVWIGGLKAFRYEDEGIVPFVANSPLMSFFYQQPEGEYRHHMNREGELSPANREWLPRVSTVGSFLVFGMSLVTLPFLITTPECWVPALGSTEHGFPLLSGAGRLVVKDAIMAGAV